MTILGTVADAKNAVSASTELSGDLTIGTIESICESIFPDLLKKFHQLYPNVSVSIVLDSPDVLLDRMNKNSIDLVYLLDQPIDDKRFIKVLEAPENISFVSSSVHTLAKNDPTDLASVISHPFLLTEKMPATGSFLTDIWHLSERRSSLSWKLETLNSLSIC